MNEYHFIFVKKIKIEINFIKNYYSLRLRLTDLFTHFTYIKENLQMKEREK